MIRKKKGFTIVELVIVIAVIGILAAVLIPTFVSLNDKANKAADDSLVHNLNTALRIKEAEQGSKNKNMHEVIEDLDDYGYRLTNLVTRTDEDLVWDQNEDEFKLTTETDKYQAERYWEIRSTMPTAGNKRSIYAGNNWNEPEVTDIDYGFDVGSNTNVTLVSYKNTGAAKDDDVIIRTNSSVTELNVNAPVDTVRHFGVAGVVDITSIAPTSYHENGTVSLAKIKNGRLVVTEEAEIAGVHVVETNGNYNGIKIAVVGNAQLPSFTRDDVALEADQSKLVIEVQTLQQESTVPTVENTQYVWITGVGENEVSSSVSSSSTSATAAVTTESAIATAVKTEARESTSAEELEQIEEAAARYAGGIGTETKPYLIKTEQHINSLNEDVMNHLTDGVYYKLIDNLELANFKVIGSSIFTSYGPQSGEITGVDMFEGTLDGDNHYITYSTENIACSLQDGGVGFFSIIKGATIKNITFNATIDTPNARNVGAVTGSIDGDDYHDVNTFQNITINGTVKGCLNAGGIAGVLAIGANVENCVNNASIILETISTAGYTTMGGFFGQSVLCWDKCGNSLQNHVVTFTNCVNNGSIYVSASYEGAYYCGSNFIGFASDSYKGTYNFTNCSIGQNVTVNTSLPTSVIAGGKTIRTGYTTENYSHNSACMYIGITEKLTGGTTPLIVLNINGTSNDFSGYFVD